MPEEISKAEQVQPLLPVAIAVHVFDSIAFQVYYNHLVAIAHWATQRPLVILGRHGLDAATARNQIVDAAISMKCSHILFLDADHIVPLDMLSLLMETGDQPMVSGVVCKKGEGFSQVAFGRTKDKRYLPLALPLDGNIVEVGVCAFGCTLINLETLQKLKKPYFRDTCVAAESDVGSEPMNIRSDVNLCNMFRENGEKVWIDTRVLVGHYGIEDAVYPQNAEHWRNLFTMIKQGRQLREGMKGVYFDYEVPNKPMG